MKTENPFSEIRQVFHEPNRMAILSALLRAASGLSFTALKSECRLTDGNLSRHLRALEDLKVVRLTKSFVDRKPRTTVSVTERGRTQFLRYLDALESALKAAQSATEEEPRRSPPAAARVAGEGGSA